MVPMHSGEGSQHKILTIINTDALPVELSKAESNIDMLMKTIST